MQRSPLTPEHYDRKAYQLQALKRLLPNVQISAIFPRTTFKLHAQVNFGVLSRTDLP